MPKLYGETIAGDKMRVDLISYSGNKAGGIEVDEVLEGEGIHYVDPSTGRQWFELEGEESAITKLQAKMDELSAMIESLKGDPDELGD